MTSGHCFSITPTTLRATHIFLLVALAACSRATQAPSSSTPSSPPKKEPVKEEWEKVDDNASRGVPKGYVGRTDDSRRNIREVLYRRVRDRFEIVTGPAHIMYAPGDTIAGSYIVATTFTQRKAPVQPEAFGLFIGGAGLDTPAQRYGYYMARGTGEFTVKVREGDQVRDIVPWTAHPSVPRQDDAGYAVYRLAIRVGTDSIRFLSGGIAVATVARSVVPADGVFGLRVNHNLQLIADEVRRSPQ